MAFESGGINQEKLFGGHLSPLLHDGLRKRLSLDFNEPAWTRSARARGLDRCDQARREQGLMEQLHLYSLALLRKTLVQYGSQPTLVLGRQCFHRFQYLVHSHG